MSPGPARAYLLTLLATALCALGLVAAVQIGVDGLGLYGVRLAPERVLPARARFDAGGDDRMVKALETLRPRGPLDIVFLGSSRMQYAFDPARLAPRAAYNAAMRGARVEENAWTLEALLAQNAPIKRIVWNVDFWEFFGDESIIPDETKSPFRHPTPIIGLLRTVFAYDMVRRTLVSFGAAMAGTFRPVFTTDGFVIAENIAQRAPPDFETMPSLRNFFDPALVTQQHRFDAHLDRGLGAMARVLEKAHARGVAIDVVLLPEHITRLALYEAAGLWPQWEAWKRAMAALVARVRAAPGAGAVAGWDFTQPGPIALTPLSSDRVGDPYFFETLHVRPAVADRVMARLDGAAGVPADFGAPLDEAVSAEAFGKARETLAAWRAAHPAQTADIRALVDRARTP